MNKKLFIKITSCIVSGLLFFAFQPWNINAGVLINESDLITADTLKFIKPPADFRSYFMLQSIGDITQILIGDFAGAEKVLTLVTDRNCDNTIDAITEYYPDSKKFRNVKKLNSRFFKSDIAEIKKEIIEGTVYEKNYSYKMKSLSVLKSLLNSGVDIFNTESGWLINQYDPEKTKTIMNQFFFKVKDEKYDLIFKTNYYVLYSTVIQPPISYSVYCKETKDPVVGNYVKELLKMLPL